MAIRIPDYSQLHPVQIPDPVASRMKALGLQTAQLQNQDISAQIQERQAPAAQKQRQLQKEQAIAQALMDTNGSVEAALGKIAQIAPDLLPHFQKFVTPFALQDGHIVSRFKAANSR